MFSSKIKPHNNLVHNEFLQPHPLPTIQITQYEVRMLSLLSFQLQGKYFSYRQCRTQGCA